MRRLFHALMRARACGFRQTRAGDAAAAALLASVEFTGRGNAFYLRRCALGELDFVWPVQVVDGPNLDAVRCNDVHVFGDLAANFTRGTASRPPRTAPSTAAPKASMAAGDIPLTPGCAPSSAPPKPTRARALRRAGPLAQKKGRAENHEQRPVWRMATTSAIGTRASHHIAEGAARLPRRPQQRAAVKDAGNDAPLSPQGDEDRAGDTCRNAAQEERLERRQVGGDQLYDAVANQEDGGRGEHAAIPLRSELRFIGAL
jgi:hypothetical protein